MNDPQRSTRFSHVREFFFKEEIPFGLALLRIAMPLLLLIPMLQRWPHVRELFSADGATAQLSIGYGYGEMLPELPGSVAVLLFTLLIVALVFSALGWLTRPALLVSCVLYTYFNMLDSVSTMTKYSVIATHVLLLLSLSECGAVWSVDSWLRGRKRRVTWPGESRFDYPTSAVWPRRLIQLMLGGVYFGAAVTKMHTPSFFTGDHLSFWMLTEVNYAHPMGHYLSQYVPLLAAMGYITLIWEITFIFCAWKGFWRPLMLGLGIVFHIMTFLTLGLVIFPLICIAIYASFLNEQDVRHAAAFLRRWQRRWNVLPAVLPGEPRQSRVRPRLRVAMPWVTAGLLLAIPAGAVKLEHALDPYGVRRSEGPHVLQPIPRETAQQMLTSTTKFRDRDRLFYFDVGTIVVNGAIVDRRRQFQVDDRLVAQCTMTLPHEDTWLVCEVLDEMNHSVLRTARVAPREYLRVTFTFNLRGAVTPGNYSVVVKSGGRELARRSIEVLPE